MTKTIESLLEMLFQYLSVFWIRWFGHPWFFRGFLLVSSLPPLRKFSQKPYESLGIKLNIILFETKLIIFLNIEPRST